MRLSIIIPAYNVENYIEDCLESIIGQNIADYEIILIDDGSTDTTGVLCDKYSLKYSFVKVIHQKNGGLSKARNIGVVEAQGEYLFFVDSDDMIADGTIKDLMEILDGSVEVIAFSFKTIYQNTDVVKENCHNLSCFDNNPMTGVCYLNKVLELNPSYAWYACLYCINKKFFLDNKYKFEDGKYYEDLRLTYRILLSTQILKVIKKDIYCYRSNRKGAITEKKSFISMLDYLDMLLANMKDIYSLNGIEKVKKQLLNNMSYAYYVPLALFFKYSKSEQSILLKKLSELKPIVNNTTTGKQMFLRYLVNIVGIRTTSLLLYIRIKIKNRI